MSETAEPWSPAPAPERDLPTDPPWRDFDLLVTLTVDARSPEDAKRKIETVIDALNAYCAESSHPTLAGAKISYDENATPEEA